MKTPPDSSIAKLFAMVSPAGRWTERTTLPGVTYPTTPDCVTNQIRPAQSGSALWMPEPSGDAAEVDVADHLEAALVGLLRQRRAGAR